ncbi:N5-carboxyaminoimidazole ribonucleotide synthase [Rubripirellula obstinata]|uniref:N5-carboxyaminoimidazole ribonucleotide synthase n=1 Tax=Rubripirellula obstinata TaxID=406547 RepID=A0A5B1CIJ6_9BACT|nr:5-(carboxyamino)imidazole ribonucleotide synthase [Rubripirellula obstinata]KAA1259104.1 N5-carboxyaminoimidazole ribonucleotide synthase [Rubripirellula obstinata]
MSVPVSDAAKANQFKTIQPGGTIGMVGGGQLGRMFSQAAAAMGYHVVVFCESADTPAAQVAHRTVIGKLDDQDKVQQFASQCDVITLEFENIPAETMRQCNQHAPTYPAASVLAIAQDRLIEKRTLRDAGLPVTPFVEVHDSASLVDAAEQLGWPLVVKTAREGYDGKGQHKINSEADADQVPWASFDAWIAEKWMPFEKEVSVVVAFSSRGESTTFPVFENDHCNHILDVSFAPAKISDEVANRARSVATKAAEALGLVGLMCVEFFVIENDVVINEVAPRPHNSGHLTIEANQTSQFEQHVRAVCGLPLGSTAMKTSFAAMANLLGDVWFDQHGVESEPHWDRALDDSSVHLHLYGKKHAVRSRKMGHLTVVGDDAKLVRQQVIAARDRL